MSLEDARHHAEAGKGAVDQLSDAELLRQVAAGERAAFAPLVRRHGAPMERLARALLGDGAAAADARQEALLAAFKAAATFDASRGSARSWLLTITRNVALKLRRARRELPLPETDGDSEPLDRLGLLAGWGAPPEPEAELEAEGRRLRLAESLASLSAADRELLVLRDVEDLDGAAVAELLAIPLAAMKSRLHRARLRLLAAQRASEVPVSEQPREVAGVNCGTVLSWLGDAVDGELPSAQRELLGAHLSGCSVCERFGGRYTRVVRGLKQQLGVVTALDEAVVTQLLAALR